MNNSSNKMNLTFGESQIEKAIRIAKEHFQGVTKKPYYNAKGFVVKPPPVQQGQEINSPRHNPYDLPSEDTSRMDSDDYKL